MRARLQQTMNRAARSTFRFGARRVAASDWLSNVVYDAMNETNFAGLAEHEEMLNDAVRVRTYHRGIHRNVAPGDVVLDLGTGTGLLAFMASRAGARKVYAVEHSDFIEVAREIGRLNGITNVEYVQANSRDFNPPEPIDVVIHEQMGDELFNENMIENLLDLRRRVLRRGGRILPSRFRLFIEPVVMRDEFRVHRIWNTPLPDELDLSGLQSAAVIAPYFSGDTEQTWARAGSIAASVGTPTPVLEFDLATLVDLSELPHEHHVERVAGEDAIVDGVCVWFETVFDEQTTLSTSPLERLTSWGNRMYRVDREVGAGESFSFDVRMGTLVDANTWRVELE